MSVEKSKQEHNDPNQKSKQTLEQEIDDYINSFDIYKKEAIANMEEFIRVNKHLQEIFFTYKMGTEFDLQVIIRSLFTINDSIAAQSIHWLLKERERLLENFKKLHIKEVNE